MPLVEARSMLAMGAKADTERSFFAAHDPDADHLALSQLAEKIALEISPLVAIEPLEKKAWAGQTLHQSQTLLVDVTGSGEWFGDESQLGLQTASVLQQAGWIVRIALTSTVGSAWAIAHAGSGARSLDRYQIPLEGTGSHFWQIPPEATSEAIGRLPITSLRLPVEAAEKLQRLGIEQIAQLLELPRGGIATRLGKEVLMRIDQALGHVDQTLPVHHATTTYNAEIELEYPTAATDLLQHRIEQLIGQLASKLRRRQQGALRLSCRFDFSASSCQTLQVGLFAPTADHAHLNSLLQGVFERQPLEGPVQRIAIMAPLTGPLQMYQPSLLQDDPTHTAEESSRQLACLIDGLSSRLGRTHVLGVRTNANPLPEQAFRPFPLTGRQTAASGGRQATRRSGRSYPRTTPFVASANLPTSPLRRPLDLLSAPEPIQVLAQTPTGEPARLQTRRSAQPLQVQRIWGPERIETGWWKGPSIRRDYYRLETTTSQWLWVFRQLGSGQWYLHGWFG